MAKKINYPLLSDAFNSSDINEGIKVLKSKFSTMSKITKKCEIRYLTNFGPNSIVTIMFSRMFILFADLLWVRRSHGIQHPIVNWQFH